MPKLRFWNTGISVELYFFVLVGALGFERAPGLGFFVWIGCALASLLWHECGHALAARLFGQKHDFHLWSQESYAPAPYSSPKSPLLQTVTVSLAGPLFSLGLGFALLQFFPAAVEFDSVFESAVRDLILINCFWGAINLLPIAPLDVGILLEPALLDLKCSSAEQATPTLSLILCSVIGSVAFLNSEYLVAIVALYFVAINYVRVGQLEHYWHDQDLTSDLDLEVHLADLGYHEEALIRIQQLKQSARTRKLHNILTQRSIHSLVALDQFEEALKECDLAPPDCVIPELIRAHLLFKVGRASEAASLLEQSLRTEERSKRELDLLLAIHAESGDARAAQHLFDKFQNTFIFDAPVYRSLARALLKNGQSEKARAWEVKSFELFGEARCAYNIACSFSLAGQPNLAIEWLGTAIDAGFDELDRIENDNSLLPLAEIDEFKALKAKLA